jgi:hypothetical protein
LPQAGTASNSPADPPAIRDFDGRDSKILCAHNFGDPISDGVVSYDIVGHQHDYVGCYNVTAPEVGGGNPTGPVFALKKCDRGIKRSLGRRQRHVQLRRIAARRGAGRLCSPWRRTEIHLER